MTGKTWIILNRAAAVRTVYTNSVTKNMVRKVLSMFQMWLLILFCLSAIFFEAAAASSESQYTGKVFEVTSTNAYDFFNPMPDQGILIEFYAPWCEHCKNFRPAYEDVAVELTKQSKFRVGACDITANAAMTGRFDIKEIPVLYLYSGGELYKYSGPFHASAVKIWASKEFKNTAPLPAFQSPLGPLGRFKGLLIHAGVTLTDLVPRLAGYLRLPEYMSAILIACFLGLSILSCTFLGVFVSISHEKDD